MGKGEQTRGAILDEASRIASQVGLQGLTIGTLASQTRLSKSGLFAHFRSKEALQLEVLDYARQRFIDRVVRPALAAPRGEPRVRELFERWLAWSCGDAFPGGCLFMAAAVELDDQPGAARDRLVRDQRDWMDTVARVVRPTLAAPRGEPRVRELFERWLAWSCGDAFPGGCLFMAAAVELDDQPGATRDRLVRDQRDWMDTIARVFRTGIETGDFRADASPEQFAQDLYGVLLAFNHTSRLLGDPLAEERARRAFEALLAGVRRPARRRRTARAARTS